MWIIVFTVNFRIGQEIGKVLHFEEFVYLLLRIVLFIVTEVPKLFNKFENTISRPQRNF